MPTGRLAEAAVPLAPLQNFDGVALSDTSRTDMDGFRHLYATALSARVAGTETLPGLPDLNQRVKAAAPAAAGGAIPVAVQYISYGRLRPDAATAGLVTLQNEQLYDVAGRTASPYQTQVLFAAAPERTYSTSSTVSLVLPRSLYLADGAPNPSPELYLDFGDGQGYRRAGWDQPLSTTYATPGPKRIKVHQLYLIYTGGFRIEHRYSWFDLKVFATPAVAAATAFKGGPVTASYLPTLPAGSTAAGFNMVIAPTAGFPYRADYTDHRGATVNVRYGQGHTSIVKPFIVVEQYNTTKVAPHLVGENNQENTIETFLRDVDRAAPYNFNDALQKAGYDLIYIDFTENLDDIRRNAALFEQVLRWANEQKRLAGSTEKNVVMGMSMGGLIGRYGLSRMVRNGYDPQTRLLVLHDSPQRGAINPMGLQALSRQANFPVAILPTTNGGSGTVYTSALSDKLTEALAILDAPATRQLSIKSVTGIDTEYEDNTFIDGPYKDMINFSATGGPPTIFPAIVATSDGSQCGRPQNTPVYQELTRDDRDWLLGPSYIVRTGIQSEAVANALPAYGTQNRIAHLRVWFTIRVLWARFNVTLLNRNYTSPANTLPYETLPGGNTNLNEQQDLTTNHDNSFLGFWHFSDNTTLYNGDLCFAPTFSTLDVQTVTPATAFAKYVNNTTDNPSPPRVVRYIAQEQSGTRFNLTHLRFTARNSEWIYNEMQRPFNGNTNAAGCSTECIPLAIASTLASGQRLCAGSSATFSIPGLPAGTTVTWAATPANNFTVATGSGPTFTTAASSIAVGNSTITATVGSCQVASLTVPTGPGEPKGYYSSGYGSGTLATYQKLAYPGVDGVDIGMFITDPYNFAFTADLPGLYLTSTQGTSTHFILKRGQGVTITATATNAPCGLVGRFVFICPSNPYGYRLVATPNPTSSDLVVVAVDADQPATSTTPSATAPPFEAELYDNHGKKVQAGKSDKGKTKLAVRELPAGLYHLRAGEGKEALSEQIQIAH